MFRRWTARSRQALGEGGEAGEIGEDDGDLLFRAGELSLIGVRDDVIDKGRILVGPKAAGDAGAFGDFVEEAEKGKADVGEGDAEDGGGEADEEVVLVEQEKAVKGEIAGGEGEGGEEGFKRREKADEGGGGGAEGKGDGEGDPKGRTRQRLPVMMALKIAPWTTTPGHSL